MAAWQVVSVIRWAAVLALAAACVEPATRSEVVRPDSVALTVLETDRADRFGCPDCRIRFSTVVDVGEGVYGPNRLGNIVRRDRHGRYWISRTYEEGSVAVYDSAGEFLTTVSRPGEGPGEMRNIRGMAEGAEGMYLIDAWNHRLNVFDDSLRLIRMHPFSRQLQALEAMDDGTLILWTTPGMQDPGIRILNDSGGVITTTMGGSTFRSELQRMLLGDREIATGRNGEVLVADAASYRITVIRHGEVIHELTSDVDWFDSYAEYSETNRVPLSRLSDIVVDEQNRAWVLISVPNPTFKPDPSVKPASDMIDPLSRTLNSANTIIEVWDLNTGTLITGMKVSPRLIDFADAHHVYTYIETPSGEVRLRVWRMTLEDPDTR